MVSPAMPVDDFNTGGVPEGREEIARTILKSFAEGGFGRWQQLAALTNANAASGLDPNAKTKRGFGLFQLNTTSGPGSGKTEEQLLDPAVNVGLVVEAAKNFGELADATKLDDAVGVFVRKVLPAADPDGEAAKQTKLAERLLPKEGMWGDIRLMSADSERLVIGVRQSGPGLTVIFDNFGISLQTSTDPLIGSASFSFRAPYELPRRRGLYGFRCSVLGSVIGTKGARVLFQAAVGTATKAWSFPYGRDKDVSDFAIGSDALFSIEDWGSDVETGGMALPRPPMIVSVTLIAQRRVVEESLLAQIDSLDFGAASYDGGGTQAPG